MLGKYLTVGSLCGWQHRTLIAVGRGRGGACASGGGWQTVAGCKAVRREVAQICRCYAKVLNLCVIHP